MMKLLLLFLSLVAHETLARNSIGLRSLLIKQKALGNLIGQHVEEIDCKRFDEVRNVTDSVLRTLKEKGQTNTATNNEIEKLVVTYRASADLFSRIQTVRTREYLVKLIVAAEEIAKIYGFDDGIYSQMTLAIYRQTYLLVRDLTELPLDPNLSAELKNLIPHLGKLLAKASLGDNPEVFAEGRSVYAHILKLNPIFNTLSASNAAFDSIMEIQNLNEFFGALAQINTDSHPGVMP